MEAFVKKKLVAEYIINEYYPEPDSDMSDKVKVFLDLLNCATKKELEHTTTLNTSNLATQKDFITLKAEVDKLNIAELVNIPSGLNNLKTKVDDLHVHKLKTGLKDLNKLSDVVDKEGVKKPKLNTLSAKVNNLEKKIPDASTLIQTNQYNTHQQNLEKKLEILRKKFLALLV